MRFIEYNHIIICNKRSVGRCGKKQQSMIGYKKIRLIGSLSCLCEKALTVVAAFFLVAYIGCPELINETVVAAGEFA